MCRLDKACCRASAALLQLWGHGMTASHTMLTMGKPAAVVIISRACSAVQQYSSLVQSTGISIFLSRGDCLVMVISDRYRAQTG